MVHIYYLWNTATQKQFNFKVWQEICGVLVVIITHCASVMVNLVWDSSSAEAEKY